MVFWHMGMSISEEHVASIFRIENQVKSVLLFYLKEEAPGSPETLVNIYKTT
jgi:hypothetical protein